MSIGIEFPRAQHADRAATAVLAALPLQVLAQAPRGRPLPIETYESADIEGQGSLRIVRSITGRSPWRKAALRARAKHLGTRPRLRSPCCPMIGEPLERRRCTGIAAPRTTFRCSSSSDSQGKRPARRERSRLTAAALPVLRTPRTALLSAAFVFCAGRRSYRWNAYEIFTNNWRPDFTSWSWSVSSRSSP